MERILKIALEAELRAQNIIDEAEREKQRCADSIAAADKVLDEYMQRAQDRVAEYEKQESARAEAEKGKEKKRLENRLSRLDKLYQQSVNKWVDTLYRSITEKQ